MSLLLDFETTGLLIPGEKDPAKQPRAVEIAAIKVDSELKEISRMETLINPGAPLPPEAVKWYDITDEMLKDAPSFPIALKQFILPFWLGEETVIAYNVEFDLGILHWELVRLGWEFRFPYCHAVVDAMQWREGKRLSLDKWSRECLGEAYAPQTHRAMDDVERMLECMRASRKTTELIDC